MTTTASRPAPAPAPHRDAPAPVDPIQIGPLAVAYLAASCGDLASPGSAVEVTETELLERYRDGVRMAERLLWSL